MRVADVGMAVNAILHALCGVEWQQCMYEVSMARNASALRYSPIAGFDLDRIFKSPSVKASE